MEIKSFLGPGNGIEPIGECHLGSKKLMNFENDDSGLEVKMYIPLTD
jgi:hypothetical protein